MEQVSLRLEEAQVRLFIAEGEIMNGDLLKRLFRAAATLPTPEIDRVFNLIIEDESKKGHETLAKQLSSIWEGRSRAISDEPLRSLAPLNRSRRSLDLLVGFKPKQTLRHHMVLSADVEFRFQRIEKEYAARDRLNRQGFMHRRRILMYGPPGCGKSLGAERLAWNTGLPFYRVRFDALISSVFGESASNLRKVFEMAREQPCLLFLDECDFIARSRKATNDVGEIPRIVNTLLQLMEDFEGSGLVVAATNLTESLDEALFRRFDDVLEVPLPTREQAERLLRETLAQLGSDSMPLESVLDRLASQSAAFIVKVAQDACKGAILSGRDCIDASDLATAAQDQYRS
jgi:histone H3/H4